MEVLNVAKKLILIQYIFNKCKCIENLLNERSINLMQIIDNLKSERKSFI